MSDLEIEDIIILDKINKKGYLLIGLSLPFGESAWGKINKQDSINIIRHLKKVFLIESKDEGIENR